MLDMLNPTANNTLLISHLDISLTNLEPLQLYFICLNCICSVITIPITIPIPIPITLTTISTPETLIYLLLASFASSPSPRLTQFTNSQHDAISQPSLLLTVFKFKIVQINCDYLTGRLNQFGSSSTSRRCKGTGVHALLALNLMFYCTCRADPIRSFAEQLQMIRW